MAGESCTLRVTSHPRVWLLAITYVELCCRSVKDDIHVHTTSPLPNFFEVDVGRKTEQPFAQICRARPASCVMPFLERTTAAVHSRQ